MMQGRCHCGQIAFEVEGEPSSVIECNCTHCSRKGLLLWFVPSGQFRLVTPDTSQTTYLFNRHMIEHRFCPQCGCQPFAYGKDPKTGNSTVAVNVRCLEDVDLASIKRQPFDGLHLV